MLRNVSLFFSLVLLGAFSSCFKPDSPGLLKYGTNQEFISADNRSKAEKLHKTYPDDAFYGNETEVLVEFYLEDAGTKKKSKKKTPGTSPKKEKELDESLKTNLKAKVTYYHSVLAIKDFVDLSDGIYYNDMMRVSPIYLSYDAHMDKAHWSRITSVSSSYEVDGLYYSDARIKYFNADIPARGTELHYTYTITYENINYLANLFFLDGIPTAKKNVTFQVPDWLEMDLIDKNLESFGISRTAKRGRNSRISDFRDILNMENQDGEEDEEEETGSKKKRKKRVKYSYHSYEASNLPAQEHEILAAGPTHNQPHVLLSLKKYTDTDGKEKKLLATLPDLYSWYRSLVVDVDNDTAAVSAKAREIVADVQGDEEKVKELFYWVQDNVRYIAYEDGIAGFKPEACQKVFENRYGDCKGMANLLTQMLRSLGYDARLTWIGTRRIAYTYSEPGLAVDNHMICTLILNGKHYFLDPTEDFIAFGDYAHRIQGRQVLIENGDSFMVDTIPNLSYERNRDEKTETLKLVNNDLVGEVKLTYRGESKTNILRYYHGTKSDRKSNVLERFLNDGNINLKVTNIKHDELSERNKDIDFTYQLNVKNRVLKRGDDWLVNLDWETELKGLELDSTRISDVDFGYKMFSNKTCKVEFPANTRIRYMPAKLDVNNADYRILMEYKMEGNTLVYTKQIIFYDGKIPAKGSKEWAEVYKLMTRFYSDYVVLSRN